MCNQMAYVGLARTEQLFRRYRLALMPRLTAGTYASYRRLLHEAVTAVCMYRLPSCWGALRKL